MHKNKLRLQYQNIEQAARRLQKNIVGQIEHLLAENEITLGVPLETRIKPWPSISEKIERKTLTLKDIRDLDDLIGIRLIPLFKRDTDTVCTLLRSTFQIVSEEDTSSRLDETQFGYQSRHMIIKAPDEWLSIPTFAGLDRFKSEIQVRSLAQHIWAAASHKLQYKREASVPPPLRRTINRISALLETVDLEFDRVLGDRDTYLGNATTVTSDSTPLNVDILTAILDELLPRQNKLAGEEYDELLANLTHFKINTAGKLRRLVKTHYNAVMKSEANEIEDRRNDEDNDDEENERIEAGVFFTHVGLMREALRKGFGEPAVNKHLTDRMKQKSTA